MAPVTFRQVLGDQRTQPAVSDASDLYHAVHLAERFHDTLELRQGAAMKGKRIVSATVVAGAAIRFGDVDVLRAERLAYRGENAGLVGRGDAELHRTVDLGFRIPGHIDAALWICIESLDAFTPVNGNATPASDEANDVVAG